MSGLGVFRPMNEIKDLFSGTLFNIERTQLLLDQIDLIHRLRRALTPVCLTGLIAVLDSGIILAIGIGQLLICLLNSFQLIGSRRRLICFCLRLRVLLILLG